VSGTFRRRQRLSSSHQFRLIRIDWTQSMCRPPAWQSIWINRLPRRFLVSFGRHSAPWVGRCQNEPEAQAKCIQSGIGDLQCELHRLDCESAGTRARTAFNGLRLAPRPKSFPAERISIRSRREYDFQINPAFIGRYDFCGRLPKSIGAKIDNLRGLCIEISQYSGLCKNGPSGII